jgi:hypothetical protein
MLKRKFITVAVKSILSNLYGRVGGIPQISGQGFAHDAIAPVSLLDEGAIT